MLSDATLIYIKASCAEGERLATDTTMELIDEVRKLRGELAVFKDGIPAWDAVNSGWRALMWHSRAMQSMGSVEQAKHTDDCSIWLRRISELEK